MRTSRRVLAVALTGIVAGGAALAIGGRSNVAIPDEGPWVVVVSYDPTAYRPCVKDSAVASDTMTASVPSTGGAMTFQPEATRSDVERVVRCVTRYVPHSKVHVGGQLSETGRPVLPVPPPAPGA